MTEYRIEEIERALPPKKTKVLPSKKANGFTDGNRDNALFRMARMMRQSGVAEDEALQRIAVAAETCAPPFDPKIAQEKVTRIYHQPAQLDLTDTGLAELHAFLHGGDLRYHHLSKKWMIWNRVYWSVDADGEATRRTKDTGRYLLQLGAEQEDEDYGKKLSKAGWRTLNKAGRDAILKFAPSEPPLADSGVGWDADPWSFCASNGVIDLKTGKLRDGRPQDLMMLHSDVAYDPDAQCPRFEQFIDEIFAGDRQLIAFVQRAVGYALTGTTSEQCLFLMHGDGSNGKTVLINALKLVFGDYFYNCPVQTLEVQRNGGGVPNDIAALRGKRMVVASEANEKSKFNAARVKALTGGDTMTARFLFAEFFDFTPVCKFFLATNHLPKADDDSIGFWRRVRVIPFHIRFIAPEDAKPGDAVQDRGLEGKLLAEAEGILAWAVRGCLDWQKHGLQTPASVRSATEGYQDENDPLAEFINEFCETGGQEYGGELFKAYQYWARQWAGLPRKDRLTQTAFGRRMGKRFKGKRTETGKLYEGIGLSEDRKVQMDITNYVKPDGFGRG